MKRNIITFTECFKHCFSDQSVMIVHKHHACYVCVCQIYICGGFSGTECLSSAESFNPETNQWTLIAPMSIRRSGVGVIAYADLVYAVSIKHSFIVLISYDNHDTNTEI